MAYLVRIGAQRANKGGVESRGYHIYRRGVRVYNVWGPIEVHADRVFYWCRTTQHQERGHYTIENARVEYAALVKARETEGYSRLPRGVRILRDARSKTSTRKI